MHRAAMLRTGYETVAMLSGTRFLLVSFDESHFFMGFCFTFLLFGIAFGAEITKRRLKSESLASSHGRLLGCCQPTGLASPLFD